MSEFDAFSQQDRAFGGSQPYPDAMITTELREALKKVTAERDRLKVALMDIKHYGAGYAQDRARKALGGDVA